MPSGKYDETPRNGIKLVIVRRRGTPTIVFLDAKGEIVLRRVGYVEPAQFARLLDELSTAPTAALRNASPR